MSDNWGEVCLECWDCLRAADDAVEKCIRWLYDRKNQYSLVGIMLELGISAPDA